MKTSKIIILSAFIAGIYLVPATPTILTTAASEAVYETDGVRFYLSETELNTQTGQVFTIDIVLNNPDENPVDGIDIYSLNYDPVILAVVDSNAATTKVEILAGEVFPMTVYNKVDTSSGKIQLSQISDFDGTVTASGVIATITFQAIKPGTSELTFDFTPESTVDTNVASMGEDILTAVNSTTINIE